MPRNLTPPSAFPLAIKLARAVVADTMKQQQAEQALLDAYPKVSPRAASGYIGNYIAMRRGAKGVATTIAAGAWKLYLQDISQEGAGPLFIALGAFQDHIRYIKGKAKSTEPSLRRVHDEFVEVLKGMAAHEDVAENLDAAIQNSLRSSPRERKERLASASKHPEQIVVLTRAFRRNPDVIAEVLLRANGTCEGCEQSAPFQRPNGKPYLEVHHRKRLADGGEDTVENATALCPNCHREQHYGINYTSDATK